jgi:hypothetical protein
MSNVQVSFFIPGNTPSLKNSKIKTSKGIFPSKTVTKYLRSFNILSFSSSRKEVVYKRNQEKLFYDAFYAYFLEFDREKPIIAQFHFVRGSRHKFDFNNANQIIADLFSAHDFIEDDNMDYFIPSPFKVKGNWYSYDANNPGVWVKLKQE